MSVITTHERPGVYSAYEASGIAAAKKGGGAVALLAAMDGADGSIVYRWHSHAQAVEDCGQEENIVEYARLALKNGASMVYAIPVGSDYYAGFDQVSALGELSVVYCDTTDSTLQGVLANVIQSRVEARKECLGVVSGAAGESVSQLITRAYGLNSERIVMVAPDCMDEDGNNLGSSFCAAAVAGLIAGQTDPAVPLGGAVVEGLPGLVHRYTDTEVDRLVRGGVTALDVQEGVVSVIRGVTTRTVTDDTTDYTWKELTTIMVVDEVIPGVRNALKNKFARAKNNQRTRGAILAQVVVELENYMAKEIIDSYEDVSVTALEDDPTVCLVEFAFGVTHGLNQIWLSAHITV